MWRTIAGALLGAALWGCAPLPPYEGTEAPEVVAVVEPAESVQPLEEVIPQAEETAVERLETEIYRGTGVMVRPSPPGKAQPPTGGEVVLNFENADLREVIKVIIGDMLGQNFIIDPQVRGAVTIQTSRPLTKDALLPMLETLLRMNGAALLRTAEGYEVRPLAAALQGTVTPQLADVPASLPPGHQVMIVPLKFVSARDMQKLLEPFTPPGSIVRVDELRNVLVLAGAPQELNNLLDTITVFDVDWLAGMSVGIFPLQSVDAETIASDLENVFGDLAEGPLTGLVRITPLERLNALLVVTSQPKYLDAARLWIERLDRSAAGGAGRRIYVYQVQNSSAEHLAEVLGELFGEAAGREREVPPPELAPGLAPAEIGGIPALDEARPPAAGGLGGAGATTAPAAGGGLSALTRSTGRAVGAAMAASPQATTGLSTPDLGTTRGATRTGGAARGGAAAAAGTETIAIGPEGALRIIADKANNTLVIMATPAEYEMIVAAIRRLDIIPRQVLIEATIAEVTLSGSLRYGLQWYFKNKDVLQDLTGYGFRGGNRTTSINDLNLVNSGFSYALSDASGIVHALLDTLASKSLVNVLSSPSLLVIDNQTAQIKVGNQVPVLTGTSATDGGVVTESVQYRDTGVLLEVTPRINAGGLVTMEVSQEVTNVGEQIPPSNNVSFLQRSIVSNVAVQSGQTVVLGGLISDTIRDGKTGVPVLYELPILGNLFGNTTTSNERTELIVLITPRVVRDQEEARRVTEELRQKVRGVVVPLRTLERPVPGRT